MDSKELVIEVLVRRLSAAVCTVDGFRSSVASGDVREVVRWHGADVLLAAARCAVFARVVEALRAVGTPESKATVETIREYAVKEALRRVVFPSHSTSPLANLDAECEGQAWGEVAELLRGETLD